jgi:hypothetical protein
LAPLGNLQALRFYALQKGSREEEAAAPPPGFTVQNLGPELRDFGETAAAISQLDLVLSVDTSVAHLAGAMGKPVWLMLPKAADWRWLEHREESPWYPTMRLFRQRVQGEWSEVVERVGATLHALRNGGKIASSSECRGASRIGSNGCAVDAHYRAARGNECRCRNADGRIAVPA